MGHTHRWTEGCFGFDECQVEECNAMRAPGGVIYPSGTSPPAPLVVVRTSHGLTSSAPLRLHLRYAFHDWMWGGADECGRTRRLCRRLPTYFSDPDATAHSFRHGGISEGS